MKEWLKAIAFSLLIILLLRLFFFELYTVPSSSMEKTIFPGDYVIVSKLKYGPRMPQTPLSLPFAHQRLPFFELTNSYVDWIKFPYIRFGRMKVDRGDLLLFNWPADDAVPVDQRSYYIKRCVGIPGDTLEIINGYTYTNTKMTDKTEKLLFNYQVVIDADTLDKAELQKLGITEEGIMRQPHEYCYALKGNEIETIKKLPHVVNVERIVDKKDNPNVYIFPDDDQYPWNADFYGPLIIPKKGDSVALDVNTISLYERIIRLYEKNDLIFKGDSVFVNHQYATHYRIKMNYYFVIGDNRHNSADSRFWGFVPEDHIIGYPVRVLFSLNKTEDNKLKVRWGRTLKKID